jgi:hypothetical protein
VGAGQGAGYLLRILPCPFEPFDEHFGEPVRAHARIAAIQLLDDFADIYAPASSRRSIVDDS